MITHCYTLYHTDDPQTQRRNELARTTWKGQGWLEVPVLDAQLPRMWRENGRAFPFLRDVFDCAVAFEPMKDPDILIYTNADICVALDCAERVLACLERADACYAYRRDFPHLARRIQDNQIGLGADYAGSDLCAFRAGWWRKHREEMPDMVLGLEAWDPCYRTLVEITNPGKQVCLRDIIYHERHNSYWERPENRHVLEGQKHCLRLAAAFLRAHGINPAKHGIIDL